MLTYADAKKILAQYAGRGGACINASKIDLFVREVFEYLLYSSAYQDLRKFTFLACKGVFTVPTEVESIQKVKIGDEVGQVWDKWFEFHNSKHLNGDCIPPDEALFEEPNYYATAYDMPYGGGYPGVIGTCDEASDAHVIVQGKDATGREIFTVHKGERISGEYLSICNGTLKYTQVKFSEVTNVIKSKTNGYVTFYSYNPTTTCKSFLSDYSPLEEKPSYRRYRLTSRHCCPYQKVSILARVRLKEAYSDNDKIPFDTILTLRLGGQRVNADYNNDLQTAAAKDASMTTLIERENSHKRVQNGQPIEFLHATSAGRIQNTIQGYARRIGWWR